MSRATTHEPDHVVGDVDPPDAPGPGAGAGERPGEPVPELDDGSGAGGDGRGGGDGGGGGGGSGPTWARALVLAAATAFLGVAVGVFVSRDDPPGEESVDVGFYQDMLTHHQQALGVATLELAYGEDAVVRSYAREVLMFQSQEIGVMRQTLVDWGHDPADRLFLELMAEHHRGGLHMAEEAGTEASDEGVRRLAEIVARSQAQEINEYRQYAASAGIDVDIPPADVPPDDLPPDAS